MTHISEIPAGTLVKQAHAGVKLITEQYPEAAAILREAITRFDVLREVHQLAKQEAQPVIPIGLVPAINRLLDSDGSRGRFSAMELYDARKDLELLLASAAQPVSEPYKLPELNDELIEILGRPNFTCTKLAECLRNCGQHIKRKSEHEQAAVLHVLLNLYIKHGNDWRKHAEEAFTPAVAQESE